MAELIVKHCHGKGKHASWTDQILAALSTRFWIISGREEIREWEKECSLCRRRKAKATKQVTPPLPQIRLRLALRAFAQTAVDFIVGLFTCLATTAVHLEMANSGWTACPRQNRSLDNESGSYLASSSSTAFWWRIWINDQGSETGCICNFNLSVCKSRWWRTINTEPFLNWSNWWTIRPRVSGRDHLQPKEKMEKSARISQTLLVQMAAWVASKSKCQEKVDWSQARSYS